MSAWSGGQTVPAWSDGLTRKPVRDGAMLTREPIGDGATLTPEPIGDVAMVTGERRTGGAFVLTREWIGGADLLTWERVGGGAAVRIQNRWARGADIRGRGRLGSRTEMLACPRRNHGTGRGHSRRAIGSIGCAPRGIGLRPGVAGCGRIGRWPPRCGLRSRRTSTIKAG
jgi:hypothetical protein